MKILFVLATVAAATMLQAQSPLATGFNSGSPVYGPSGAAAFFDLTVKAGVSITALDVNTDRVGTVGSIEIFTIAGTHVGNESNAAGWTLRQNVPIVSAGLGLPTPAPFATPVVLAPGTVGVAIVYHGFFQGATGVAAAVGDLWASTAELDLHVGSIGYSPAFNGVAFSPLGWNGNIYYGPPPAAATKTVYGVGCQESLESSYFELSNDTTDLAGAAGAEVTVAHTLNGAGDGYDVAPGASAWFAPTSTELGLGDDAMSSPFSIATLTGGAVTSMPLADGTSATEIYIGPNGYLFFAAGGSGDPSPTASELLDEGFRMAPLWADWQTSSAGGGGTVHLDAVGNVVYVTWLAVHEPSTFGSATATFQVCLDTATGDFEYRYGEITSIQDQLVGYSPGNGAADNGGTDISASLPFSTSPDRFALALDSARPVTGSTMNITTSNIPPSAVFTVVLISGGQVLPGVPLLGVNNGCSEYVLQSDVTIASFPTGSTQVDTVRVPAGFDGTRFYAQSFCFAPGYNALGIVSSNGLEWLVNPVGL